MYRYNLIAPLIHLITYKKIELAFLEVNTFSMTKMFNLNVLFTNLLPYLYCVVQSGKACGTESTAHEEWYLSFTYQSYLDAFSLSLCKQNRWRMVKHVVHPSLGIIQVYKISLRSTPIEKNTINGNWDNSPFPNLSLFLLNINP